ncbi:MAG TPA: thymidine kinase [Edaphocola sp.]|nr:thymidine kinase [Edaphocola sp.]
MFLEPQATKSGWIEVICGSMFSGKTEELIRRMKRAQIAKQKIEIFKPSVDTRYSDQDVVSHNANSIPSTPIENSQNILLLADDLDVIGIDEAQFFDPEIVNVVETMARKGVRVIIAGLDMDYKGQPFGMMPQLLATADYITKLHAICVQCGQIANYTYRKNDSEKKILLGESDLYEPRCRHCFQKGDDFP